MLVEVKRNGIIVGVEEVDMEELEAAAEIMDRKENKMELNDNATMERRVERVVDATEKVRIAQEAVANLGDSDFFMIERRVNGSFGFTRTIKALETQYYLLTNEDPS